MLGGSFWIAALRNSIGAVLMMTVFLLLDRTRYSVKKTVCGYIMFGLSATAAFSFWYLLYQESYIRFSGMCSILAVGFFCIFMSGDTLYLAMYKLALGFYLLSLTVFAGIDIARLYFAGNIWADIFVRILLTIAVIWLITARVRKNFLDGIDYLREEMDWFSGVTTALSILIAALTAFWPGTRELSRMRIVRTSILFFLAGVIQYLVFQVYLHRGKERRYQVEKELLQTNERLIKRQLDFMKESKEELDRIRHDVRHHCLLIEEYIQNDEKDKLLSYVKKYREEIESRKFQDFSECICCNETINSILYVYAKRAREEQIQVTMRVNVKGKIAVQDIDLVAVIANLFENAIHGCTACGAEDKKIYISVMRKGRKMVVQCKNTCALDVKLKHGLPEGGGTGILSILKVVSFYNGEAEFAVENGMFVSRILLNIAKGV